MKAHYLWLLASALLLTACGDKTKFQTPSAHRGVYHWKTTYDPTDWEKKWMKDHKVDKLYIKLFDVEVGEKAGEPDWKMVPVATTVFKQKLPNDMEVVPVVYITVDAIRPLEAYYYDGRCGDMEYYARLIVKRIDDMMAEHYDGTIREVQLDCDWTMETEHAYFLLAENIKDILHERNITLSGTLRLHQLREVEHPTKNEIYAFGRDTIPFDRSLLMCYNTGRLQDRKTENSILDFDDVEAYLNQYHRTTLPRTDIAYPVFGWGVMFWEGGNFCRLINAHNLPKKKDKKIRVEWGEAKEIRKVQSALPVLDSLHTVILYHLDSLNLSKYSYEDVEEFYSR